MEYEWSPQKAGENLRKHRVDFADAVGVFADSYALTIPDEYPDEDRFVTIGADFLGRVLVVVYTYRGRNIRLISARKATARERLYYEVNQ